MYHNDHDIYTWYMYHNDHNIYTWYMYHNGHDIYTWYMYHNDHDIYTCPEAEPKRTKREGKVYCIGVPTQGFITLRYMSIL